MMGDILFENPGYCVICESETRFVAHNEWLRDYYFCARCGTIPRQRALITVLNYICPDWKSRTIHESSPVLDFFRNKCKSYTFSHYYEDTAPGSCKDGVRCENLEHMTFDDRAVDIFVTQDVMEHVFDPDSAFSEIMRVLKPGGFHIFTAPKYQDVAESYARARLDNGIVVNLCEPEYHGNPVGDGRSLVTWVYGRDFEQLVMKWSGYQTSTYILRDRSLGIDGEFLEVFVTRKLSVNELKHNE